MKNNYKDGIKQISDLTGLSDEGIRIYEKYGLVYPSKKEGSNIRVYDAMDLTMLHYGRMYRQLGFSLKESKELANQNDLKHVLSIFKNHYVTKTKEIELEQMKLKRLNQQIEEINQAVSHLNEPELTIMPSFFRIEFMENLIIDYPEEQKKKILQWSELSPFSMISTRYEIQDDKGNFTDEHVYGGFGIFEEYADFCSISLNESVSYYSSCKAVHCIMMADNEKLTPDFSTVFDFIKAKNLKVIDDVVTLGLANIDFNQQFKRYFHVWIPVQ